MSGQRRASLPSAAVLLLAVLTAMLCVLTWRCDANILRRVDSHNRPNHTRSVEDAGSCNMLNFNTGYDCDSSYYAFSSGVCYTATVYISNIDGTGTYQSSQVVCNPNGGCTWYNYGDTNCQDEQWNYGGLSCNCIQLNFMWTVTINGDQINSWDGSIAPPPTPPPTPAPTYPGGEYNVTQKDCTDNACSENCNLHSFPTGACLGGGVVVYCSASEVVELSYVNDNCTGDVQQSTMPLNQCLQSNTGYFENFCVNVGAVETKAHEAHTERKTLIHPLQN